MRAFGVSDGLAHSSIRRIVTDSSGLLWFCTDGGLSRFDGSTFVSYATAEGLPSRVVNDILEDVDRGTYWVATSDGLYRFFGNRASKDGRIFEKFPQPLTGSIRRVLLDRRHRLWIAATDGLAVLEADRTRRVFGEPAREGGAVFALLETSDGAIWAGTQADGLYRVAPDGIAVRNFPGTTRGLRFIRDLLEGPDGRVWCTFFGGVARLRPEPERFADPVAEILDTKAGMLSSDTSALLADGNGGILAGTTAGIARLQPEAGGAWRVAGRITMREGLISDAVRALAFDPAGGLWIGTIARGAMKLVPEGFRRYPSVEESASIVVGVVPDEASGVLVLTAIAQERYRIHRLTEVGETALDVSLPPAITYLGWGGPRIARAKDGGYWIATGEGLLKYRSLSDPPERRFGRKDGLPGADIFWIAADARGTLFVGVADAGPGGSSLAFLDPGARRFAATAEPVASSGTLASSFVDAGNGPWVGFWNGTFIHFEQGDRPRPIVFDPPLSPDSRYQVAIDSRKRLWVLSKGVQVADDPLAAAVRLRPGPAALDGLEIYCAVEDDHQRIYFGTERGVFRFDEAHESVRVFTRADGLPGDSIAYCTRDAKGGLWFADTHGVARLDPAPEREPLPLRARVAAIRIDGEAWPTAPLGASTLGPIELAPGPHRVAAEFFAIDHTPGERVRFQHRLEGKTEWSVPSDARTLEFPRLVPGRHRLLVRAVPEHGAAADPVLLDLLIPPPIWQRWWFLTLAVLAALAAASAAYRLRVGRLLALERMRTRIATDLHDAVGADLSRISLLADVAQRDLDDQPARARTMLGEVARTARDAVREMSDIVWALQSKPADLAQVLGRVRDYAADMAASTGIALSVIAGEEPERIVLGDEGRRELYLLLKEAVNNAIRHAGASTLTVEVRTGNGGIVAEVRDDGHGFPPESPGRPLGGRGIGNMRARAARLGGTLTVEGNGGRGTTVRLELPSA